MTIAPERPAPLAAEASQAFARRTAWRRRQIPRALLVGLACGVLSGAFRVALEWTASVRALAFSEGRAWGGVAVPLAFCAAGAALAIFLVRRFVPEASGSGIPHVEEVLLGRREMRWRRLVPVKFVGGASAIGAGLALGREGPTVQMGAAVGQALGERLGATQQETLALLVAGAGAGLAASFNAPLAGMMFVLEELQRDFSPGVVTPAFVAAVTADVVTRMTSGQAPIYDLTVTSSPPLHALPVFCLIGVVAGLTGPLFNQSLLAITGMFRRIRRVPPALLGAAVGVGVGIVGLWAPEYLGDGSALVAHTLSEEASLRALMALIAARFVLTMVSYGCGAPGGIFAPLLVLGGALGRLTGQLCATQAPSLTASLDAFAAVGMGAYFTGVVRAPLTGTVLMIEMTGCFPLLLPLLVASLAAWFTADALGDAPIYEALVERDLAAEAAAADDAAGT